MKKIILFATLIVFGLLSCSDDNGIDVTDGGEEIETVDTALKLKASKTKIEPFEKLTVRIDLDEDIINETYDSIRWNANGIWWNGIITIPNNEDPRDVHFTDYSIGNHEISILGYKDDKVISKATIEYEVQKPQGNFLNVRWGISTKFTSSSYTTGRTPIKYLPTIEGWTKMGGVRLLLWHIADSKNGEYVDLHLEPWSFESNFRMSKLSTPTIPYINDFDWHPQSDGSWEMDQENYTKRCEQETEFLYNYMIALYGAPILEYDGEDPTKTTLWDEYNERFNNLPRNNAYPCVIWETSTSYLAMNHHPNSFGGKSVKGLPAILAEPRYKK